MRKIVIDGSNTSGFQRTMLVATGGGFQVGERTVGVQSICLEEDASKLLSDDRAGRKYGLDRLGVPLVEIALEPVTGKPAELKEIALTLGRLLRASRRVARGLGSIRQDVNISIKGGNVIEVKGVQQLDQLSKVIEFETLRQHCLLLIASELRDRKVSPERIGDVTDIFSKSQSKVVAKIRSSSADSAFVAVRIPGFVGLIGYEPYPGIRLGKELGKLVSYFGLDGIFHSDELPNYGISGEEVDAVRARLHAGPQDAFLIVGGPPVRTAPAILALKYRLEAAFKGPPAETRAATPDGQTIFLRPRPGSSRM